MCRWAFVIQCARKGPCKTYTHSLRIEDPKPLGIVSPSVQTYAMQNIQMCLTVQQNCIKAEKNFKFESKSRRTSGLKVRIVAASDLSSHQAGGRESLLVHHGTGLACNAPVRMYRHIKRLGWT